MPHSTSQPAVASTPPRTVPAAARRRAWGEPRVRVWLLAAGVILAVAIYWTIAQVGSWYSTNRLVREGVATDATVYVPQDFNAGNRIPNRSIAVRQPIILEWSHDGQAHHANAVLDEEIVSGEIVPIYIDPANPSDFTTRTQVSSLAGELFALTLLLPAVLITGFIAWIQHRRVLGIYTHGEVHPAIVVETRSSALTPLSRQVRCTLQDLPDKQVITVTLPTRHGVPSRGDLIPVITPPGKVADSIAAAAYEV